MMIVSAFSHFAVLTGTFITTRRAVNIFAANVNPRKGKESLILTQDINFRLLLEALYMIRVFSYHSVKVMTN